jgi:amidase
VRLKNQSDLVVAGPIARSAADLALLLPILASAGREGGIRLRPARQSEPKGLRVAVWADDAAFPVDAGVRDGVLAAADRLEAEGAIVTRDARPGFSFLDAFEVFALLNHALVAAGLPEKVRDRIAARAANYAADDRSHEALQARGAKLDANLYGKLQDRRRALKQAWERFFADYDVLLCPPAPINALSHDHEPNIHARRILVNGVERPYFDIMSWAGLATASHLPAAAAPVGLAANGLPTGVQIVAGEHEDMTAIAVAAMIEKAFGGYRVPPMAG